MLNQLIKSSFVAVAFAAAVFVTSHAGAAPLGAPAPDSDYGANSGAERFTATGLVFGFELMSAPTDGFGSFGIYYEPGTLIPLFSADDVGAGQAAMVDLVGGSVMDVDQVSFEYFTPQTGDFGFYFDNGGAVTYSEFLFNIGNNPMTSIGTYKSLVQPDSYLITLEWWNEIGGETLAIEAVGGINAVPEPSAAILFGMGGLLFRRSVRRGSN